MRTPVLVSMVMAAVAVAGWAPAPEPRDAGPISPGEACQIMAAAIRAHGGPLNEYLAYAGPAVNLKRWPALSDALELSAEERADLSAGAQAGTGGLIRCDWRRLGFRPASLAPRKAVACQPGVDLPLVSASGRLAVTRIENWCLPDMNDGEICLLEKSEAGWAVTGRCVGWYN